MGEAVWKRHVDQIRGCALPVSRGLGITECVTNTHSGATSWGTESGDETGPLIVNGENNDQEDVIVEQVDGQNDNTGEPTVAQRYPTRCTRAPLRYGMIRISVMFWTSRNHIGHVFETALC